MGESLETAPEFFDRISARYTSAIERCVPRYREMLWALLYYLPDELAAPRRVLELGCGSGNLSLLLRAKFPGAELTLVDASGQLLEECRGRLAESEGLDFRQEDFRELAFEPGHFDLAISSISLHHLKDDEKSRLFARLHEWLRPGGCWTYSDQFAGETPELYEKHLSEWERQSRALGATDEEWIDWMRHQREADHHAPLRAQLRWMESAGFVSLDCPWRHLLWTIVQGRKR
ncbi:MAG: class I SAM-dependent methyltransferase [Planctomycetota bacterium]